MVRRWLALGAAASVLAFASAAASQSSPDPLVAVLVERGVISQADAAGVTTRDQLVKVLQAKGILNQTDVNSIAQAEPTMLADNGAPPPNEAPVYFHQDHPTTVTLGPVDLTVGGFVDVMGIFRTNNEGTIGTNFFNIPFTNSIGGHISDNRVTAQNSRLSLKAASNFDWAGQPVNAVAYFEGDFLGNDAANTEVTSESHTFRVRQFFVDAQRGQWEVLAGQAWSWTTPNRYGLSSYPDAMFITNDYDPNYNVGLTWSRLAQFRVIYHVDPKLAVGVAVVNPDQFGGQGETTFPSAFNAQLATQIDSATESSAPDEFPDLMAKVAYDDKTATGLPFHLEAVGLVSQFRVAYLPEAPPGIATAFTRTSTTGWGVELNGNVQVMPGLTLLGDAFYSQGEGRYIGLGLGPDIVALPVPAGPQTQTVVGGTVVQVCCSEVRLSDVHSESFLGGVEWQPNDRWTLNGYYGWVYFDHNFALDTTSTRPTPTFVGFGSPNSANSNNKYLTEFTIEPQYKIWSSPTGGVLSTGLQYSYVWRRPWFVPAGAPTEADISMFIFDVRYTLP
jgi:hypothetical protein